MTFLLDHLPDQLHLVIATRADPPLPLARLRSRGQLVEVRGADLRFTPDEAQQFLTQAMGWTSTPPTSRPSRSAPRAGSPAFSSPRCRCARSRPGPRSPTSSRRSPAATGSSSTTWPTRSWPGNRPRCATSCCAPRSSTGSPGPCATRSPEQTGRDRDAGRPRPRQPVRRSAGHRTHLVPLPPPVRRRAARTPAHRGPRPGPAAAPAGQRLVRRTRPARGRGPARPRWPRTSREPRYLVEEALPELRRARQDSLLLSWIRALPGSVVRRSPVLSIVAGWARMMTGDLDGLESCLDDADAALAAGARDPDLAATWAQTEDLRTAPATILVYRASLAQARGDVAGTVRHARAALDLAGPEDHFVRGGGGRVPRPGGLGCRRHRGSPRHVLRGSAQPARRGKPGR